MAVFEARRIADREEQAEVAYLEWLRAHEARGVGGGGLTSRSLRPSGRASAGSPWLRAPTGTWHPSTGPSPVEG